MLDIKVAKVESSAMLDAMEPMFLTRLMEESVSEVNLPASAIGGGGGDSGEIGDTD
jgi:hypothetical protein